MKAHLMYRDRDFGQQLESMVVHPHQTGETMPKLVPNEDALVRDLELNTLFEAMAGGDKFLFQIARLAILSGLHDDLETLLYRQAALKDALKNYSVVKEIFDIAGAAIGHEKRRWWGIFGKNYPAGTLHSAVEVMQMFMEKLGRLKTLGDQYSARFESEAFKVFFAMLKTELAEDYFGEVKQHLKELRFNRGVLISAQLGRGNQGTAYVLRKSREKQPGLISRFLNRKERVHTIHLHPRDEAGARAVGQLRDRGVNIAANALAQSADHILNFFVILRTELAFHLACTNLHRQLDAMRMPLCFPVPAPPGAFRHACLDLRDVCLALSLKSAVVGNDLNADRKKLCVITGANKGGKSTFLRSIGLAQLMMQCGMFVTARSFRADICRGLFTHYKREEDAEMKSGKFDEELARMSKIVEALTPGSLLLFNESFAATNDREGSAIAGQIVQALLETPLKIFFVTHLYEFARARWDEASDAAIFLCAERQADGTRTFKLLPGEPQQTSFGLDLYQRLFGDATKPNDNSCIRTAK